jgi:putative endonuclease
MADHNELGILGENLAAEYLRRQNYEILERNWVYRKDELDIIALYENKIVIAEVKTRKAGYPDDPEKAVTRSKQKRIIRAANSYIVERGYDLEARFDILVVLIGKRENLIRHIPDAFYPML